MSDTKFITFEGGDGCGKTTQSKLLAQSFEAAGQAAILTREPGGTESANAIRQLLVEGEPGRWDPVTETLLHFAARREHVERVVKPALAEGKWVVCDRFVDSTLAYQGYGHGVELDLIHRLHELTIGNFGPALTFIFDIDPEQGLARASKRRDNEDRYEKMDISFHQRLREGFLAIAEQNSERCVVLDGEKPIEELHNQVIDEITTRYDVALKPITQTESA